MLDTVLSDEVSKVTVPMPMEATEDPAATTPSIALTASLTLIPLVLIPVSYTHLTLPTNREV